LDIRNIISSAFDGASNMSGRYNGLQAALIEVSPSIIYTHCYAHSLKLVIIGSCSRRETLRRLQNIGITRWWAKDKAPETIFDVNRYAVLLKTLYSIAYSDRFESNVRFEAQSILQIFLKFDTILVAFVFKTLFKYTTPVSKYLQTVSLDYLTAHQLLKSLGKQLSNMAIDSISTFDNIFKAASRDAQMISILSICRYCDKKYRYFHDDFYHSIFL
ncbi:zinc finger MYM-type protein 1-like, partial [Aphis craccivora]